jgi:hypothetical protein
LTDLVGVEVQGATRNVEDDGRLQSGENTRLVRIVRIEGRLNDVVSAQRKLFSGSGEGRKEGENDELVAQSCFASGTDLRHGEESIGAVDAEDVGAVGDQQ